MCSRCQPDYQLALMEESCVETDICQTVWNTVIIGEIHIRMVSAIYIIIMSNGQFNMKLTCFLWILQELAHGQLRIETETQSKIILNIPILSEAFLTFASKSST